jgi:hypothetical protein
MCIRKAEPEQKKNTIEQITSNTTEEEIGTSTLNVRQRKSVMPGERQTFLHRRNQEFSTKQRKTVSESSKEDTSVKNNGNDDIEPLKQPQILINCNT